MHQYGGCGPAPLLQWLADSPKPRNQIADLAQFVARQLVNDSDMGRAWLELAKKGVPSMTLLAIVGNAYTNAKNEVNRQTDSEAAKQLDRVADLICKLKEAILESPLPANVGRHYELRHANMDPLNVVLGWHGMNPAAEFLFHPVSVVDTLDTAAEMLLNFRNTLPARAVLRHTKKGNPEVRAFVVNLGWLLRKEYGSYLPGTLARVANAIYNPKEPLDKEAVKDILKCSPEPYTRFKTGGVKAVNKEP